jgi:palmitoyltransferase
MYLLMQVAELWYAGFLISTSFKFEKPFGPAIFRDLILCCDLIFVGLFGVMVTGLMFFHSYLAARNMTTWELASWSRISYLRSWPKELGSPFSGGIVHNLSYFICGKHLGDPVHWEVPPTLPEKKIRKC